MTDGPDETIARILAKLADVRARQIDGFGAKKHRYELNPPATEADVAVFEAAQGVTLPAGYRQFLTAAGDGGAGPYCGILPLAKSASFHMRNGPSTGFLVEPSPLRPGMSADAVAELGDRPEAFRGSLTLAHQGCTYVCLLIVTGPYRGRVAYVDLDLGDVPPYFTRDTDFLDWYERWLDELRWGYDTSWFGYGLPGREPELAAVLADAQAESADVVVDAFKTLTRLPTVSPPTLALAAGLIESSPAAEVRLMAIEVVAKYRYAGAALATVAALDDPDPDVRKSAVDAAVKIAFEGWTTAVRRRVADPNRSVASRAESVLNSVGELTAADVRPLLASDDPAARMHGIWMFEQLGQAAIAEVVPLLADADIRVRGDAILTLSQAGRSDLLPAVAERLTIERDPQTLAAVVRAVGEVAYGPAVRSVIALADHADGFVRLAVARTLGQLGDSAATVPLRRLADDHTTLRRQAEVGVASSLVTISAVARASLASLGDGPRT